MALFGIEYNPILPVKAIFARRREDISSTVECLLKPGSDFSPPYNSQVPEQKDIRRYGFFRKARISLDYGGALFEAPRLIFPLGREVQVEIHPGSVPAFLKRQPAIGQAQVGDLYPVVCMAATGVPTAYFLPADLIEALARLDISSKVEEAYKHCARAKKACSILNAPVVSAMLPKNI